MRVYALLIAFLLSFSVTLFCQPALTSYVNPLIGTAGHGHTFPGAMLPFGMVQLSPDTDTKDWDWCSGYHASDNSIMGFSHLHLSGTGCAGRGDVMLMPCTGTLKLKPGDKKTPGSGYRSQFDHASEVAKPGYYKVFLKDYDVTAELTATRRAGFHKYTFATDSGHVLLDLGHGIEDKTTHSSIRIISPTKIEGIRESTGWAPHRTVYYAIEFSKPFHAVLADQKTLFPDSTAIDRQGESIGCFYFSGLKNNPLLIKVGISSVDAKGAWNNLSAELPGWDFEKICKDADDAWQHELSKISVSGKNEEDKTTFYTALYHSMETPNLYSDCDGRYRGMDNEIHVAANYEHYTVFSLWDTFRAEHPLFTIIDKKRSRDFVLSLLDKQKQFGQLPIWEFDANETYCMIGYHALPVIADAIIKGIGPINTEEAYEAMKKSAEQDTLGLRGYKKLGYVPADKLTDAVSRTIEYAYDDWCLAQIAKLLHKDKDYAYFMKRAVSYKNVFDPVTGFMRGRFSDGRWRSPFDPIEPFPGGVGDFTEGSSWQYSWFVPQNVFDLIDGMGGDEKFCLKLDSLFTLPVITKYQQPSDMTGLIGQYAHGNEPSHHTIFMFNFAGQPWRTQFRSRQIQKDFYTAKLDGLCGNDDCGQMSAWYVLNAIGFYPLTPGSPTYTWGSPLFDTIKIHLESGKTCTLIANGNSADNIYIKAIAINGKSSKSPLLLHADVENGSTILLTMTPKKEEAEVFDVAAYRKEKKEEFSAVTPIQQAINTPYILNERNCFTSSLDVPLYTTTPGAEIHYTLDGTIPALSSPLYSQPLHLNETTLVKALTFLNGKTDGDTLSVQFYKSIVNEQANDQAGQEQYPKVYLANPYLADYPASGENALVDGKIASERFRDKNWQAFLGKDLDATIDLGKTTSIRKVTIGVLHNPGSWILLPDSVSVWTSTDGTTFRCVYQVGLPLPTDGKPAKSMIATPTLFLRARYVRVFAKSHKILPEWHSAAGNECYLFADEIMIEPAE